MNTNINRGLPELKPPLKWAGGKRWLTSTLQELWLSAGPPRRLVDPFCGGLSVALGLQPGKALLNDINPHAINFYHWLQRGLRTRIAMRNERELFYAHRGEFNQRIVAQRRETKKCAELFYYLNRTGYNGLCRFNQRGAFNVPFGRYCRIHYQRDFSCYKDTLSCWHFTCGDFENINLTKTDFIYADPPYDVKFTQYSPGGFDWESQVRLANWLSQHKGPVVASNQATKRIIALYKSLSFKVRYIYAPRFISRSGDRTPAREILASRNI